MARLKTLVRFGLGGKAGRGTQGISWIHEADLNRLFERALTDATMHGAYLATAPNPVSQRAFMRELRRAMHVPIGLPAFEWMVRLAAPLSLRTDPELARVGRYLVSNGWRLKGFEFRYSAAGAAVLEELLAPERLNALALDDVPGGLQKSRWQGFIGNRTDSSRFGAWTEVRSNCEQESYLVRPLQRRRPATTTSYQSAASEDRNRREAKGVS